MRTWTILSLLIPAIVCGSCLGVCPAADKRPNVIFIMADDHASHAMSCYGSRINKTPNLDRLANEGIRFDNCFCTNSICGPSRAVILTGKHSHINGFIRNGNTFDGSQQTVAKLLNRAGYQTAMIGKWHLKSRPTGFDYWHILPGQGAYYNPTMIELGKKTKHRGYVTDIITDIVLEFLRKRRDPDKPFFVMYHHKAPHRNWQPGPEHLALYDDVKIPEPETLFDDYAGRTTAARTQEMTIARHMFDAYDLKISPPAADDPTDQRLWKGCYARFDPQQRKAWDAAYGPKNEAFRKAGLSGEDLLRWKYQRYIKDYLRTIASIDDNLGRLLDYLDKSGLAESTVIFYTSDQGFYLGEHGWFDKRFMYEESLRMPLVVRWPGRIKSGTVSKKIVMNLDFAETFLDLAGEPIPDDMQGRSLRPLLEGDPPADWRKSMYYRYYEFPGAHSVQKHYGVRTERHKLIFFHELGEWELFDLQNDPNELRSVYNDPAYFAVVKELKRELERLRKKYKDDARGTASPSRRSQRPATRSPLRTGG